MQQGASRDWILRTPIVNPLAVLALLTIAFAPPASADTLLIGNKGEL